MYCLLGQQPAEKNRNEMSWVEMSSVEFIEPLSCLAPVLNELLSGLIAGYQSSVITVSRLINRALCIAMLEFADQA